MNAKKITAKEIKRARETLGLPAQATLAEIKKAYQRQCRNWHPDLAQKDFAERNQKMQAINEAYRLLVTYCQNYSYPLEPKEETSDEDWWMERFGRDPLWSNNP